MKKDIVAGLGEIGEPIYKLLSKNYDVVGYDLNHNLMNQTKFKKFQSIKTSFLHITIPVNKNFNSNVLKLNKKSTFYVNIKTVKKNSNMNGLEQVHEGFYKQSILFVGHLDHPFTTTDGLSGCISGHEILKK